MEKGLKILLQTYWDKNGWKSGQISTEDFELALEQGYMFDDPICQSHTDVLNQLKIAVRDVDCRDIANAFLYSLSTRKLEYRSALGSYYYAISLPDHQEESKHGMCQVCGYRCFTQNPDENKALLEANIFNFERYKWGGVRHDSPEYALFDLLQFQKLPKRSRTEEDIRILTGIFDLYAALKPTHKIGAYSKLILSVKMMKTNKAELDTMLNILGICDIFNANTHKGYLTAFTRADGSRDPVEYKNDYKYPANRWVASDGINVSAIEQVFGLTIRQ